eukprot:4177922-Pyramimonas_sp.AAC.1
MRGQAAVIRSSDPARFGPTSTIVGSISSRGSAGPPRQATHSQTSWLDSRGDRNPNANPNALGFALGFRFRFASCE